MAVSPNRIRRLKHIEAFSAVISTGSISGAARQLGVSQPAVSQLIKALEDAIGAPLFVRRNGAIFPTSRAENLREEAVDLLAHLDRFQAQLSHQRTGLLSTVRLSASMSIAGELLPSVLASLSAEKPELKYYVSSVPLNNMIEALVQGHIDFAFHTRRLEHPSLHNEQLIASPQVAIMPDDHPLAARDRISLRDLDGCRIITSTKNDPSYHYFNALWREKNVSSNTVLQSPFAGFAVQMVRPMNAITFNNRIITKLIVARTPGMVIREVDGIDLMTPFYLTCADWQNGTETHEIIKGCFMSVLQSVSLSGT